MDVAVDKSIHHSVTEFFDIPQESILRVWEEKCEAGSWVVDNLLLYHIGLPQVVIVTVHLGWMGKGDHPNTFLLKALCCQSAPSWLKVRGW